MLVFLLSALRGIVEMLGLCLIGQAVLYLLAGQGRQQNPIYRLFALVTQGPRTLVAGLVGKRFGNRGVGLLCFLLLFISWIGLALLRKLL